MAPVVIVVVKEALVVFVAVAENDVLLPKMRQQRQRAEKTAVVAADYNFVEADADANNSAQRLHTPQS